MRAAAVINGLPPERVGLDPLSQVTSELVEDLKKLQAMGLDLSELLKEEPKRSKAEQARVNGSKSKGPVTEAGKAVSSQNALKHGLCSKGVLLPGEDPAAFESFTNDFCQELRPEGTLQKMLVNRAAELSWKLQRLPAVEGAILESARVRQQEQEEDEEEEDHNAGGIGDLLHQLIGREEDGILMRLQWYETRLERSLQKCLRELRLVKKDMAELAGSLGRGAVGSFGTDVVGSFGKTPDAHGQPSVGARKAAAVVEAPPPARGPSAARQDDGFAGVRLGSGSIGTGAVGSFGTGAVGSFGTGSVGSFGAVGSFGISGVALACTHASVLDAPKATGIGTCQCHSGSVLGSFRTGSVGSFGAVGSFGQETLEPLGSWRFIFGGPSFESTPQRLKPAL